ncbi:MAG: SMR family transporter [Vallitaleaceae bacterium]|nr:SMR family transporter [Vallitaleaceae bacterium]
MPTTMQWIGIAISMCAIALININPLDLKTERIGKSLLLFFIIGGLGDFFNKLFEMVVGAVYKDLFLVVIFASALVASLYKSIHIKKSEKLSIVFGLAVGIPNLLTAFFLINALSKLNATVVFPLYSGGAIVLSMLWSVVAFKEKLKWKKIVGIVLMLFALVLFNL